MQEVEQTIQQGPAAGTSSVTRTTQAVPSQADIQDRQAFKLGQVVWYIAGVIDVILALRIIFLLLSAARTGFTLFLYNLTQPLVSPFQGIFPAPSVQGSYFDTAALLAMIIYGLIAMAIVGLIGLLRRPA